MDSSANRHQDEQKKQIELRKQIALLQAQLKDSPTEPAQPPTTPKKRKQGHQVLLAPATPSPKKRRAEEDEHAQKGKATAFTRPGRSDSAPRKVHPSLSHKPSANQDHKQEAPTKPTASNVLSKLAAFTTTPSEQHESMHTVARSSGFTERPPEKPCEDGVGNRRDENLTVIEDLEMGPYEHKPPFDDPYFKKLEPNSGIRLSSRDLPHDEFQDYLRGRYYLSPSKLYSVARLLPNKQGYDVPVEGDWVTIAVVAERGPMRYSKAPVGVGKDDLAELPDTNANAKTFSLDATPKPARPEFQRWKGKEKAEAQQPAGKKYINIKLVDFGCRSKDTSAAGKSVIRGDASLSLLLFECDRVDNIEGENGKKEKIYRGGSRGAFERMSKLKEGAVVALLNPKILKPFQRSGDAPHPTNNVLALTPESLETIIVLGHSQDLGMCHVVKKDGKVCGGWCDKRVSDVCDYHIHHAIQRQRAGRAEFSMGTSGMSSFAKKKPAYDPTRQWGLKPSAEGLSGSGSTYVVSGHIVSDRRESSGIFVNETLGRDAQAKAARQVSSKDADRTLQQLLKRDKDGSRALKAARDFAKKQEKKAKLEEATGKPTMAKCAKGKGKDVDRSTKVDENDVDDEDDDEDASKSKKNAFSASLVKNLGFDPTAKDGKKIKDTEVQRKLDKLAALQVSRKEIDLGPRPGKLKSTVWAPSPTDPTRSHDVDSSSDDELIVEPPISRAT